MNHPIIIYTDDEIKFNDKSKILKNQVIFSGIVYANNNKIISVYDNSNSNPTNNCLYKPGLWDSSTENDFMDINTKRINNNFDTNYLFDANGIILDINLPELYSSCYIYYKNDNNYYIDFYDTSGNYHRNKKIRILIKYNNRSIILPSSLTTIPDPTSGSLPTSSIPRVDPGVPIVFPTADSNYLKSIQKFDDYVRNNLEHKQKAMKDVLEVQNRRNLFNDTYNKRYTEYIKIICIIIVAIICIWLCIMIDNRELLPDGFLTFLVIGILSIAIMFIYYIYSNISIRNIIVFDEIDYESPAIQNRTPTIPSTATPSATDAIKCTGCPTGMTYDIDKEVCVPN